MADVHSKPGPSNATGTTVTSERYILPQVNDSDPACGMRLVKTNLDENNITPEELDTLFKALVDYGADQSLRRNLSPLSRHRRHLPPGRRASRQASRH